MACEGYLADWSCRLFQDRPAFGSLADALDGAFYAQDESLAQARLARFVGAYRGDVLGECVRVKRVFHFRRTDLTCVAATSPGIDSTLPDRTSSRRRIASAAQEARRSSSASGSRLSTRRSASSARASAGNASISSVNFSTGIDMRQAYDGPTPQATSAARARSFAKCSPSKRNPGSSTRRREARFSASCEARNRHEDRGTSFRYPPPWARRPPPIAGTPLPLSPQGRGRGGMPVNHGAEQGRVGCAEGTSEWPWALQWCAPI